MEDDLADQLELQDFENELPTPAAHNKLLGAVSQLYEKKRVKAATRKEPSLEVSEFHLSQTDKKRNRIKVTDLAKVLNKRAVHTNISEKVKSAQKKAKTLPKPLEKLHADKISRAAGYEHAKRQLNRWDAIVYKQRVAEQVSFPLKNDTIKVPESTDIDKLFRKPSELEVEMAKLLKQPDPLAQKKADEEVRVEDDQEDYPLSLAEVIEKRKMMAKLRAQQSYCQAKAVRHSKIKSKKFHQVQRKARVKEQLREFEELQKKDPEAALKKLEELERTRAEERVTLRHRSTGQWAKNLAGRAKYDKEARIALAEQLSKSRELTVKLAQNKDSESEKEEEEEEEEALPPNSAEDAENPWSIKRSKDMADFLSGYRKYWESQEKDKDQLLDTAVKVNKLQIDTPNSKENESTKENSPKDQLADSSAKVNMFQIENPNSKEKESNKENSQPESTSTMQNEKVDTLSHEEFNSSKTNRCSLNKNVFTINAIPFNNIHGNRTESGKNISMFNISDVSSNVSVGKKMLSKTKKGINCKTGSWQVTCINDKKNVKRSEELKNENSNKTQRCSVSFQITESITSSEKTASEAKNMSPKRFSIEEKRQNLKTLDELFEEVEDKLQDRIRDKVDKIKKALGEKRKKEAGNDTESESEEIPSLEFKKAKIYADVDEELIEGSQKKIEESTVNNLVKTVSTASAEVKANENIDPNKFLKVKPRHLSSALPEIMSEGEDALDDEEKAAEERHLTISEAFAEDDVVDQFQKEKEEEKKKTAVSDVDLSLPGWGSWAGHNMKPMTRRKRKKFVIKFPKAIRRRDTNRGNVIINEDADKPIKEHRVSEIPFPFTSVREYEASIRTPLGATWQPQTAHRKLITPPVVTQLGAVIHPMDEGQLITISKEKTIPRKKKLAPKGKIRIK